MPRPNLVFLSFEQKLIYIPSVYSLTDALTDSLICPDNALRNLAKVEKKHTLAKLLQGFRQQVTWPTLLGGGNNIDPVYLKGDMGIEVNKKKVRTRSLAEPRAVLLWFLFVILKCKSNLSSLINPYFHTLAPSSVNHAKINSGTVSSIEAFTRILGLFFNQLR